MGERDARLRTVDHHRLDGRVLRTVRDGCAVTIVPLETEKAAA